MTLLRRITFTLAASATAVAAQDVSVPSGLEVTLFDVIIEEAPNVARFRFRAPAIAGADPATFAEVVPDMQYLCDRIVIPGLAANGWAGTDVVISMSAAEVPFGQAAEEVTQYFQPFRIENDTCIWEDF